MESATRRSRAAQDRSVSNARPRREIPPCRRERSCARSIAPRPAAQRLVFPPRRRADRIDAVPPAPDCVPDNTRDSAGDRQQQRPVSDEKSQRQCQADDETPFDDLPPGWSLDFENRKGSLTEDSNRKQDCQLELNSH